MTTPLSMKTSNPGFDSRWTCPACYLDLPNRAAGEVTCPGCSHRLHLWTDLQPVSVAEVLEPEASDA